MRFVAGLLLPSRFSFCESHKSRIVRAAEHLSLRETKRGRHNCCWRTTFHLGKNLPLISHTNNNLVYLVAFSSCFKGLQLFCSWTILLVMNNYLSITFGWAGCEWIKYRSSTFITKSSNMANSSNIILFQMNILTTQFYLDKILINFT